MITPSISHDSTISKLRIAEIFTSLQGEGVWMGVPSTFLRISGCNLRCVWCDTPYASWSPEGPVMTLAEILQEVASREVKHVVITGGEPMLFEPLVELTECLSDLGYTITIETAGTIFQGVKCDLMSISPKLKNSVPIGTEWASRHESSRLNLPVLTQLIQNYDVQLKFVIEDPDDISEVESLLELLPQIRVERIILMPEGRDQKVLWERARQLVPFCISRGWRLGPRIQIDLFGDTKGT